MNWKEKWQMAVKAGEEGERNADPKTKKIVGTVFILTILALIVFFGFTIFSSEDITDLDSGLSGVSIHTPDRPAFVPPNYSITEDTVYIDDDKAFVSATPHTVVGSDWVVFNFTAKQYTGNIDIGLGMDTASLYPTKIERFAPTVETIEKSYTCEHDFNYTLSPRYFWCYQTVPTYNLQNQTNGTRIQILFEHDFETGDLEAKTAYWNEEYLDQWKPVANDNFQSVNYAVGITDKWWFKEDFPVTAGQNYVFRVYLRNLNGHNKYWFVLKPSGQTIEQAIENENFYALDPWTASLDTDLVNYWTFDESSGTYFDYKAANNCTPISLTQGQNGIINYGANFTDVASGASCGNSDVNQTVASHSFWIYPIDDGDYKVILWHGSATVSETAWVHKNYLEWDWGNQSGKNNQYNATTTRIENGNWYHVVLVGWNGNGAQYGQIYINTINQTIDYASAGGGASRPSGSLAWNFNAKTAWSNNFTGTLDEYGRWGKALSADDITDLYNGGAGIQPSTTPEINITSPLNISYTEKIHFINYTQSGAEYCWGSKTAGASNTSAVAGATGYINLDSSIGQNTFWLFCNSTSNIVSADSETFTINSSLNITVVSPQNGVNFTSYGTPIPISYDCRGDSPTGVYNTTLYVNDAVYYQVFNSTPEQNITLTTTNDTTQGSYDVLCEACVLDECGNSSAVSFVVHTTAPQINVTYPTGLYGSINDGENLSLNWTIFESGQTLGTHLLNCSYIYNSQIKYLPISECTQNFTYFNYVAGEDTVTFNVSDNFLLFNTSTSSWTVLLSEVNQTYSNETIEGSQETFTIFTYTGSGYSIEQADLVYNGTEELGSLSSHGGGLYSATLTKTIPSVETETVVEFYWQFTLNDSSVVNSLTHNQTILDVALGNCSVGTNVLFNFTQVDERTQDPLLGNVWNTTVEFETTLYSKDRTITISEYSTTFNETNYSYLCLNSSLPTATDLSLDILIKYDADSYASEFYNIVNYSLTNTSAGQEIILYDILDSEDTIFTITYKDDDFLPVADALIQVQRKYIGEGVFKTVEIPKTDTDGTTVANLALNDVIYTFIVTKNGVVLATFNNVIAKCNTILSDCSLSLNSYGTPESVAPYTLVDDFNFNIDYEPDTREISTTFSTTTGAASRVWFNVTLFTAYGNQTICNQQTTTASGTLTCTVPENFDNATAVAAVYKNAEFAGRSFVRLDIDPSDRYGASLVFLGLLLIVTFIGVGVAGSPLVMGIFLILGAISLVGLNLVDGKSWIGEGATILWLFIIVVMIIIKGSKRN